MVTRSNSNVATIHVIKITPLPKILSLYIAQSPPIFVVTNHQKRQQPSIGENLIINYKSSIMQAFEANFANVIIRFYLMMGVVLLAGFTGIWWLGLFALPIFLTGVLGIGKRAIATKTVQLKSLPKKKNRKAA